MFYAHIILAKKGPLARVWLAAHWDKKITKAHVFETNIEKSVEGIMQPKVKLALRTSGHLLLGVVRIYSRKAKYLLADCNEAFVKIKMAFRPGMVDLPEGHREANVNAITLPEVFHDFDTALPELNDIDIEAQFSVNQSRADEITMREDYGSLSLSLHDDGFGDMGFEGETPELIRGPLDNNIHDQDLFEDDVITDVNQGSDANIRLNEDEIVDSRIEHDDDFGNDFGQPGLFEDDLFGEPPLESSAQKAESLQVPAEESQDDMDHFDTHAPSPMSSCANSPSAQLNEEDNQKKETGEIEKNDENEKSNLDQSTLIQNEDESFALAPVDASAYKGVTKAKRKRKLIVDEVKNISGEEMKAQLANTSDIVTTLDLAPPTKRLMYWKETGGVEKLFSLPSRTIPARVLLMNYNRHLVSHFTALEDFTCLGPSDLLALDHIQQDNESPSIIQNKRGRKRKLDGPVAQPIVSNENIDTTNRSLTAPEAMREQQNAMGTSIASIEVPQNESALPVAESTLFGASRSPEHMFSINDHDNIADDFNHGDMTPAGLPHGQITPNHTVIESIESIPNLPADQVSSILKEAENMGSSGHISGAAIASDWNDYDYPASIRMQNTSDEQMENETNEQFEERVLNKRAAQLFYAVKNHMVKQDCLLLSELTYRNTRKQAAQKFYSLLVLKKFRALDISQSAPYADIVVSRGPLFDNPEL